MDEHLYALELATGKQRWKYHAGSQLKAPPAWQDGIIYVGDMRGTLHAVEAASGKQLWTFKTEAEIIAGAAFWKGRLLVGSYDENFTVWKPRLAN
jgi:outer membrane protein assembly factor BamB